MIALVIGAGCLQAQTASQAVTFKVIPMNRVAIASASASFSPQRAATNSAPTNVARVGGSSYGITTNEVNQKITASLDAPLPAGTTLSVAMAAPAGAASKGAKTLGTAASLDVVTGISRLTASELPITYTVNGAAAQGAHVVTYTITSGM